MEQDVMRMLSSVEKELQELLSSKTVVGEAITLGETTVVPLVSVGFGMGVANGSGGDRKSGEGFGLGMGTGGGIRPIAVLISDKNGVRVETIKTSGASAMETIAQTVGQAVMKRQARDEAAEDKSN